MGKDPECVLAPPRPSAHRRASRRTTRRGTRCRLEGEGKEGDWEAGEGLRLKVAVTAALLSLPCVNCFKGRGLKTATQRDGRNHES